MAALSTMFGDFFFPGSVVFTNMIVPQGVISDESIVADAGISATKLEQQPAKHVVLSNHATGATAMRVPLHFVRGVEGTLVRFGVSASVAAASGGSATIDLKKNGTSILSATFNIDDGDAAYDLVEPAGYTDLTLSADDQLDVEVTAVAGTAPKGLAAWLWVQEKAQ
jgi:hypothetical protein